MNEPKVTRHGAIEQKCWECMGYYADGLIDCGITSCPLYSFMPYGGQAPNLELFAFSAKRCGKALRQKRELTDEQKAALTERLAAGRAAAKNSTESNG